jgi:hypothetical protein
MHYQGTIDFGCGHSQSDQTTPNMKARSILLLSGCLLAALTVVLAQTGVPPAPVPPAAVPAVLRPPEQLDQLLGPIALYPDALVALILPAATVPSDVVLASRFLAANGKPENMANQPWDESVKSLAHYPEVVKWMDDNLEWTKELGEAFLAQPADVMNSVQRLRARARAAGSLIDTPQQQVVMEGETICIVPAQPNVIYVPSYDPEIVYVRNSAYYPEPLLSFGLGFAVGSWLAYDCDWGQRVIWVGRRNNGWRPPVLLTRPRYTSDPDWRHWQPSPRVHVRHPDSYRPRPDVVRPRPYAEVSPRPSWPRQGAIDRSVQERRDNRPARTDRPENFTHGPTLRPSSPPPASPGTPGNLIQNPAATSVISPSPSPAMRPTRERNESPPAGGGAIGGRQSRGEARPANNAPPAAAPSATPAQAPRPAMRERDPTPRTVPGASLGPREAIPNNAATRAAPTATPAPQPKANPNTDKDRRDRDQKQN